MNTFMIYPDKVRALGNVMNNNSNVEDMVEVNSNVIAVMDENNPVTLEDGNQYVPPCTVDYDNLQFPIFRMGVLKSLYDTSLTLNVSNDSPYVGDNITITATLRDSNGDLLDGSIAFKCGNDYITNGNNTGGTSSYANTTNGVVSFPYSFGSMGEYTIKACSLQTNRYHCSKTSETVTVSKKQISIEIDGIEDSTTYLDEIPFTVQLYYNDQPLAGLEYSITLDGDVFDTGISTINGESYTMSNLSLGTHTIEVYCPGNNMYGSCSETIEFYDAKIPEVFINTTIISKDTTNRVANVGLVVEVYSETNPVENMPLDIHIINTSTNYIINIPNSTDSSGIFSQTITGLAYGSYRIDVATSNLGDLTATSVNKQLTIS